MEHDDERMKEIESRMADPHFWDNKENAQELLRELNTLKAAKAEKHAHDKRDAIISIFSGAGGDDAEDFSSMLFEMYTRFAGRRGWEIYVLHRHQNDHGGFRNLSFEVQGKGVYGVLKHESGVHRLVRISPFNAKKLRHTSFAMVEVIPRLDKSNSVVIRDEDVRVEFARSSGPGGQNVNKRETAVRMVHIPTNIAVHVDSERSQSQNREKAFEILKGKIYRLEEARRKKQEQGLSVSDTVEIEWGNQIRSYVLHPYKMVKDHRTGVETSRVDEVFQGEIDEFIEAEQSSIE